MASSSALSLCAGEALRTTCCIDHHDTAHRTLTQALWVQQGSEGQASLATDAAVPEPGAAPSMQGTFQVSRSASPSPGCLLDATDSSGLSLCA